MLASDFIGNIDKYKLTKPSVILHDLTDHLNTLMFVVLMMLSAGSLVGQILSNPITCYIPQFPSGINFEGTLQSHCWISGTYNIPEGKFLSTESEWENAWKDKGIGYYQWISFILCGMCMLFYIPSLLWNYFCENVPGVDMNSLIAIADGSKNASSEDRKSAAEQLSSTMYSFFTEHQDYNRGKYSKCRSALHKIFGIFFLSKRMGSRILGNYFLIKIFYCIVIVLQLWILKSVFGVNNESVMSIFMEDTDQIFPSRTVCHWPNVLGQQHSYNAVCLLSWNVVYKYIFGLLWFVFVGLFIANVTSVIGCIWSNMSFNKSKEIEKHFEMINLHKNVNDNEMKEFCKQMLSSDGLFLLNMLERMAGRSMVEEVLYCLMKKFGIGEILDDEDYQSFSLLILSVI